MLGIKISTWGKCPQIGRDHRWICQSEWIIHRIIRKRREHRALNQAPFKDLPRRPAGETLRIKLASLDDQGLDELLGLLLVPLMLVLGIIFLHPADAVMPIMFLLASALSSVIFGNRLSRILKERANYQLGYDGEWFVGEELSRLIAAGFEIYHDVPFDGFNMDHVVVGPRGVFVVETKARRKPVNLAGKKEFRVVFDGKLLQWPWGSDGHGVDQAKNNAQTLAAWLSSAVGENIWVMPILTLPGWMVDRTAPSKDIGVLNPKEIKSFCSSFQGTLSGTQITRVCHQLDQKCRISLEPV